MIRCAVKRHGESCDMLRGAVTCDGVLSHVTVCCDMLRCNDNNEADAADHDENDEDDDEDDDGDNGEDEPDGDDEARLG